MMAHPRQDTPRRKSFSKSRLCSEERPSGSLPSSTKLEVTTPMSGFESYKPAQTASSKRHWPEFEPAWLSKPPQDQLAPCPLRNLWARIQATPTMCQNYCSKCPQRRRVRGYSNCPKQDGRRARRSNDTPL